MSAVQRMIDRYRRFGWSDPVGEWGAIQSTNRTALREALEAGDPDEVEFLMEDLFRGPLAFGLSSITMDSIADLQQAMTWRVALWADHVRPNPLARLAAPRIGNPLVVDWKAKDGSSIPVMVDTPRHDYYASRILASNPKTVLEIGGGYGGVALQLLRQNPSVGIILVDIPETLYLADYWLSGAGVSVMWIPSDFQLGDTTSASVVLCPASDAPSFDLRADVVCSFHCLSGTTPDVIAQYMQLLNDVKPRVFYHDDVVETASAGVWMTDTFPEVLAKNIQPPPAYDLRWAERTPWTGFGDRFGEFYYERAA